MPENRTDSASAPEDSFATSYRTLGRSCTVSNDLAQVGLLERVDARVQRQDLVVNDRADRDLVDVVAGVERVTLDIVWRRAQVQGPPFEQHHADVAAHVARGDHPAAEPGEISLVEPGQIKPRPAVRGRPR